MSTPTKFHLFPNLPVEIRLRIWDIVLSIPRTVQIRCNPVLFTRGVPRTASTFDSQTPPPPLLHVNRESRHEALRVYKAYFCTSDSPKYTYISFTQDTLETTEAILQFLREPEMHLLERLILNVKDPAYFAHFNLGFLKKMQSNLKELELRMEHPQSGRGDQYRDYYEEIGNDLKGAFLSDPEWMDQSWQRPDVKVVDVDTEKVHVEILSTDRMEQQ
ncbi:hypothetical protein EJ08DRAFT_588135 [Tothia fuscella]|uniref:2EXR domain-containing protein n=1 Tax=Tothia fuscella TaxID=1048955 RepID=A0A9P4NTI7_9PEZI|nr:hypothetical protein EJ08DRAFT_588135 [Tothia fuscella]